MKSRSKIISLLKVATFLIFIGRAYQYIIYGAPFRALLWDEGLLQPIVEGFFNTPWNEYATSKTVDIWIENATLINGIFLAIAAFSGLLINQNNKKYLKHFIYFGSFSLLILSALLMKDKFFHNAQFFEHAIQVVTPLVLLFAIEKKLNFSQISKTLKILVAITFTSHGLYALGYYPIPGNFVDMTIISLGTSEDTSKTFLYVVGMLDIVLSILIFIPKISKYALWYAFLWGTATALARITGYFNSDLIAMSLESSLYRAIYRIPHGLIPLVIYFIDFKFLPQKRSY